MSTHKETNTVTKRTENMCDRETADKAIFGVNDRSKTLIRPTEGNKRLSNVENS